MIVCHGSNMIVDNPDVSPSFRDLDFGWTRRKALFAKSAEQIQ